MASTQPPLAHSARGEHAVELPPAARVRSCDTCRTRASCAIARFTGGEVLICSEWQADRSAA